MTTPEKKKATSDRTTPEQLRFYVDFLKNNPELSAGKNCPTSPNMLKDLWADVANGLNAMRGPTRTPQKWKETLNQWKNQLQCRARKHKAELMATGGGPAGSMLSDFEAQALSVFGAVAVDGVHDVPAMGFVNDATIKVVTDGGTVASLSSSSRDSTPLPSSRDVTPPTVARRRRSESPLFAALTESIKKRGKFDEKRMKLEEERAKRQKERDAATATALQAMANAIAALTESLKSSK